MRLLPMAAASSKRRSVRKSTSRASSFVDKDSEFVSFEEIDAEEFFKEHPEVAEQLTKKYKGTLRDSQRSPSDQQEQSFSAEESDIEDDLKEENELPLKDLKPTKLLTKKAKKKKPLSKVSTVSEHSINAKELNTDSLAELVAAWLPFELDDALLQGLAAQNFASPLPIQERVLAEALGNHRDVVGIAPTGSGKTLAYGLPLLQAISRCKRGVGLRSTGLVLVPTRELGLQIARAFREVGAAVESLRVVCVVGGLSVEKQRRQLAASPDVVIATPGRLWELMGDAAATEDVSIGEFLNSMRFLIIDEADRMMEHGHFQEMDSILAHIYASGVSAPVQTESLHNPSTTFTTKIKHQTLVFSATLSLEKHNKNGKLQPNSVGLLIDKLVFRNGKPVIIDTTENAARLTSGTLIEHKLYCETHDKDFYLYYLLLKRTFEANAGKCIIFLNSIDSIRRLLPLVRNLGVENVCALHSSMEQRQRLQNIDRFVQHTSAVLIATDVAARGIDIRDVTCVIHYQLPRTADLYVHRSGRTARTVFCGESILLISQQEFTAFKRILHHLHKSDIPALKVDLKAFTKLKPLVNLAKEIDQLEHRISKRNFDNRWMRETADALDVIVDEDLLGDTTDDDDVKHKITFKRQQLEQLRTKILTPAFRIAQ